jgi:hypothetical protein
MWTGEAEIERRTRAGPPVFRMRAARGAETSTIIAGLLSSISISGLDSLEDFRIHSNPSQDSPGRISASQTSKYSHGRL